MAEEPVMRVKVVGDWSEFQAGAREQRQQTQRDFTFSNEGPSSGGSFSSGGGSTTGAAGVGGAQERLNRAIEREATARERIATNLEQGINFRQLAQGSDFARHYFNQNAAEGRAFVGGTPVGPDTRYQRDQDRYDANQAKANQRIERELGSYFKAIEKQGYAEDTASFRNFLQQEKVEGMAKRSRAFSHAQGFSDQDEGNRLARFQGNINRTRSTYGDPAADLDEAISQGADMEAAAYPKAKAIEDKARKGEGSSGRLFNRFVALESIRAIGAIGQAEHEYNVNLATAGSNQMLIYQAELKRESSIASGIPFGVGELGRSLGDFWTAAGSWFDGGGFKSESTRAAETVANSQADVAVMKMKQDRDNRVFGSENAARMSNLPLGLDREVQAINDQAAVSKREDQAWRTAAGETLSQKYALLDQQGMSDPIGKKAEFDALDAAKIQMDNNRELRRAGDLNVARGKDALDARGQERQAYSLFVQTALGARPDNEFTNEGMFSIEGQRAAMLRQHDVELEQMRSAHEKEQDDVAFNRPSQFDKVRERQQQEVDTTWARHEQQTREFDTQSGIQLNNVLAQLATRVATAEAHLSRNPAQAIDEREVGQINEAGFIPDARIRSAREKEIMTDAKLQRQSYGDFRQMASFGLATEQRVTALQAQAVGPAADFYQMKANVAGVVGNTQAREMEISKDSTRGADVETAKQIGINQLRGLRAQFIEGVGTSESTRGDTFGFATTGKGNGGSGPTEILQSIDDGIKELTNNVKTLVATD